MYDFQKHCGMHVDTDESFWGSLFIVPPAADCIQDAGRSQQFVTLGALVGVEARRRGSNRLVWHGAPAIDMIDAHGNRDADDRRPPNHYSKGQDRSAGGN